MRDTLLLLSISASLAVLTVTSAQAQRVYKCTDAKGKVYYTQVPPKECLGQTTQELSTQGRVVRENVVISPEKAAQLEAEKKKKAEQSKLQAEQKRKDQALLSSYSSEKDLEDSRRRALQDAEKALGQESEQTLKAIKANEQKMASARKRIDDHRKFYGTDKIPAKVLEDIKKAEGEIAQAEADSVKKRENMEAQKKKYLDPINARYDEDRRRYRELTASETGRAKN